MPTVYFGNKSIACTTALKGEDYLHLLDENGRMIVAFDGVSNFDSFTIEDGSWSIPTDAKDCAMATFGEDGVLRSGRTITCGTADPTGGNDGDIYIMYS